MNKPGWQGSRPWAALLPCLGVRPYNLLDAFLSLWLAMTIGVGFLYLIVVEHRKTDLLTYHMPMFLKLTILVPF